MNPEDLDFYADLMRLVSTLEVGHAAFHKMEEPGPDSETALITLTQRDLLLIGMALPAMELFFLQSGIDCFHVASVDLQDRIMELVRAQRPDWTVSGARDEDGE